MAWSISSPTGGNTASINPNTGEVTITENTGSSQTYIIRYDEKGYCGEYTFTQEGEEPTPQPGSKLEIIVKADDTDRYRESNEKFSRRFRIMFEGGGYVECYKLYNSGIGDTDCCGGDGESAYDYGRLLFYKQDDVDLVENSYRYMSFSRGCSDDNSYIRPQFDGPIGNGCAGHENTCLDIGPHFQSGIDSIIENFINKKTIAENGHIVYVFRKNADNTCEEVPFPAKLTAMHWYDDSEGGRGAYEEINNGRKFINGTGKSSMVRYTFKITGRPN